jgi:hypothetical protein
VRTYDPREPQPDTQPEKAPRDAPGHSARDPERCEPEPEHHPGFLPDAGRPIQERRKDENETRIEATPPVGDGEDERPVEHEKPKEAEPGEDEEAAQFRRSDDRVHDAGQEPYEELIGEVGEHVPGLEVTFPKPVGQPKAPVVIQAGVCLFIDFERDVIADDRRGELQKQHGHEEVEEPPVTFATGLAIQSRDRESNQRGSDEQRARCVEGRPIQHHDHTGREQGDERQRRPEDDRRASIARSPGHA